MRKLIYITFIFIVSCSESSVKTNQIESENIFDNEASISKDIASIKWLEGTWIDTSTYSIMTPPNQYLEKWAYFGDSISGTGINIAGQDSLLQERFCIRKLDTQLLYIARPVKQAMVVFPLKSITKNELIFENKSHDFPSIIEYTKKGKDSLYIKITGETGYQGSRSILFKMKRIAH